jgi:hypothetical protein
MDDHDLDRLQSRVEELGRRWHGMAGDLEEDLRGLIRTWRMPGWTTPAEFLLVSGIVEALHTQTNTLTDLKQLLVEGSSRVEVNSDYST